MHQFQPCKIELKWPACCPRCGHDLRVSPVNSPTEKLIEPISPATIILKETAPQEKPTDVEEQIDLAIIVSSQPQKPVKDVPVSSQPVKPITLPLTGRIEIASKGEAKILPLSVVPVPPPLPTEELKRETPPPPPPGPAPEPEVVMTKQEPTPITTTPTQGQSMPQQRIGPYYGLLPTPNQVAFPPHPQQMSNPAQYGQIALNPTPMIISHQQGQQLPVWTTELPAQQQQPCYQTAWYRPTPPVIVQQQQPLQPVAPKFAQYSTPLPANFPFPPPFQQQHLPQPMAPSAMVPGNGIFTVQHHYLNVLPGQFQQ